MSKHFDVRPWDVRHIVPCSWPLLFGSRCWYLLLHSRRCRHRRCLLHNSFNQRRSRWSSGNGLCWRGPACRAHLCVCAQAPPCSGARCLSARLGSASATAHRLLRLGPATLLNAIFLRGHTSGRRRHSSSNRSSTRRNRSTGSASGADGGRCKSGAHIHRLVACPAYQSRIASRQLVFDPRL